MENTSADRERQMVEIAKAFILADFFEVAHPIILLDEPTAAIGDAEVRLLFDCIARLRHLASFVIVTHKLSEYRQLCDRLYVLKDGSLAGELSRDELVEDNIHKLMVGRERNDEFYQEHRQRSSFGESRLSVKGLNGRDLKEGTFDIAQGEVIGLGGLVG
jgi:ribose transport system ATP-binding protein